MQSVVNKTKKIIEECYKNDRSQKVIKECIDSIVEKVIKESMKIVKRNPLDKIKNKKQIKDLVKDSLEKCNKNNSENKIIKCIERDINSVINMAVDIMTELI